MDFNHRHLNPALGAQCAFPFCKLLILKNWSGRMDLNHRPPGPEPGALARLRYAPTDTLGRIVPPKRDSQINIAQRPKVEVSCSYPQNPQTNTDFSPFSSDLRLHVPIQKKPPENSRSPTVLCSGGGSWCWGPTTLLFGGAKLFFTPV